MCLIAERGVPSEKNGAMSFSEFILVSMSLFSPDLQYSVVTTGEPLAGVV